MTFSPKVWASGRVSQTVAETTESRPLKPRVTFELLDPSLGPEDFAKLDLKTLKPTGKALFSSNDLFFYDRQTHEMAVNVDLKKKFKDISIPVTGRFFAVFVDGEAVYTGAFYLPISSHHFNGFVILMERGKDGLFTQDVYVRLPLLKVQWGYPDASHHSFLDLRSDPRILAALEEENRLYETIEVVVKCEKIESNPRRHLPKSHFIFSVQSVLKGSWEEPQIHLDAYLDFGGGLTELHEALKVSFKGPDASTYLYTPQWNRNQKLVLTLLKPVNFSKEKTQGSKSWLILRNVKEL